VSGLLTEHSALLEPEMQKTNARTVLLEQFERLCDAPDAIPRLRLFILDLAVRGKLVEPDSSDEPASETLRYFASDECTVPMQDKSAIVEDPVGSIDFRSQLPAGWVAARMGTLALKLGAGSTPLGGKSVYENEGVPFLRSQNVHNYGLVLQDVALISRQTHQKMSGTHVQPGDILLNITGASIGRCAIVPDDFVEGNVSQHVAIIRLKDKAIRGFIHLSLIAPMFQQMIDDVQVGVSREGLSMRCLKLFPMPLPPLSEQHRIVAKVDELMALCDRLETSQAERERRRERLNAASFGRLNSVTGDEQSYATSLNFYVSQLRHTTVRPADVPKLRQTIIDLAARGVLVPHDPVDDTGAQLLEVILDEKTGHTKQEVSRAKRSLPKPWVQIDEHTIPPGWVITDLGSLCLSITDGDHLPPPKSSSGVPLLVIGNVRSGSIHYEGSRFVSKEYYDALDAIRRPRPGDILYTLVGSFGIPVIVEDSKPFCVQRHIGILRPPGSINVRFLARMLGSTQVFSQASHLATGIAQKTIPLSGLRQFRIPVPPLAEQHRIVAKVDELMALCDRLEAGLTLAQTERRRLLESLLQQALMHERA